MVRRPPILLCLLLVPGVAGHAAGDPPAGGRFRVYAGGREAGSCDCRITEREGTLLVEEEARLFRGDREQVLSLRLEADARSGRPRSFEATGAQGEVVRRVSLSATPDGLAGETREGESSRPLSLAVPEGAALLAEPFTSPWLLLAARYDRERGGSQTFPALYPLEGATGEVTLHPRGEEAIELDGMARLATHLVTESARGEAVNLWIAEDGKLLVAARSLAGLSAVRGATVRLGLREGEDPPDPAGLRSTRVRFAGAVCPLAGTFLRPADREGPLPAVLLLSGSGPQDRNGNAPGSELAWNHLHALAVALARAGVASLRYDERGVGSSGGSFAGASFEDLVADARAALDYLGSREDVRPDRIALVGHSEGALVAAVLGSGGSLRAAVLLGAPASPLDRILLWQVEQRLTRRGTPEPEANRILGRLRAFFEHVRLSEGATVRWEGQVREAAWLRQHLDLDPPVLYARLRCPVLVLHGEKDRQVPPGELRAVVGSLRSAASTTGRVISGADHFLMPSRDGFAEYGETRREVAGAALEALTGFLEPLLVAAE